MWHMQTTTQPGNGSHWATAQRIDHRVTAMALCRGDGTEAAAQQLCNWLCNNFQSLYALPEQQLVEKVQQVIDRLPMDTGPGSTLAAAAVRMNRHILVRLGHDAVVYRHTERLEPITHPDLVPAGWNSLWVSREERPQLEGIALLSEPVTADQMALRFQQAALLQPEVSQAIFRQYLGQLPQGGALAILSRTGQCLGQWERLTPRQKAEILGVRTQNSNRRRHAIRQLWNRWGRGGPTTVLWVSEAPMSPELLRALERHVDNRVKLVLPQPWQTVEELQPLLAQVDLVTAADLPPLEMLTLRFLCGKKLMLQPKAPERGVGWQSTLQITLKLGMHLQSDSQTLPAAASNPTESERRDDHA